jgi:hypothetical protein
MVCGPILCGGGVNGVYAYPRGKAAYIVKHNNDAKMKYKLFWSLMTYALLSSWICVAKRQIQHRANLVRKQGTVTAADDVCICELIQWTNHRALAINSGIQSICGLSSGMMTAEAQ